MQTHIDFPLVGHRETGHTSCPGDKLETQMIQIRTELTPETIGLTPVMREQGRAQKTREVSSDSIIPKISHILHRYSDSELAKINAAIDAKILTEQNKERKKLLQIVKILVQAEMRD